MACRIRIVTVVLLQGVLFGCAAVDTSVLESTVHEGYTYSLPTTVYTVSLKRVVKTGEGDVGNLVLEITPKRVATPDIQLALRSGNNPFFDRDQEVTFTNGLISTVNLNDTGRLSDTIVAAAESIVAVQSGGMSSIGGEETAFEKGIIPLSLLTTGPSREELDEFIKLIPNDGLTQDVSPGKEVTFSVPGTYGALYLKVKTPKPSGRPLDTTEIKNSIARYEVSTYGLNRYTPNRPIVANGILAKTMTSGEVEASLFLSHKALQTYRKKKVEVLREESPASVSSPERISAEYDIDIETRVDLLADLKSEIRLHQSRLTMEVEMMESAYDWRKGNEAELDLRSTKLSMALLAGERKEIASSSAALKSIVDETYRAAAKGAADESFSKVYADLSELLKKAAATGEEGPLVVQGDFESKLSQFRIGNEKAFSGLADLRAKQIETIRKLLTPLRQELGTSLTAVTVSRDKKYTALDKYAKDGSKIVAGEKQFAESPTEDIAIFRQNKMVELIDDSKIAIIPTYRSALGNSKTNLTITNGVLDKLDTSHPSEALELVKIPKKVVEAVLDVPTGLFKKKTAQREAELALREKELLLLEKELALKAKLKEAANPPKEGDAETYFAPKPYHNQDGTHSPSSETGEQELSSPGNSPSNNQEPGSDDDLSLLPPPP